jgi:hypothetical protein
MQAALTTARPSDYILLRFCRKPIVNHGRIATLTASRNETRRCFLVRPALGAIGG